jgi:lantibiotic modifying enzyme
LNRLIRDGLRHLVETMQPDAEELWPLGAGNPDSDPRNLQHGAAGVLAVLAEADDDPALEATLRTAAHWLAQRLEDGPRLLPGLYFGASGAIWALHDAARRLRDPVLAARATALAESVAVRWPNPDICHGAAGAGLAQLHLWRTSGHPALESRVRECADALLGRAEWRGPGVCWPIPADFDSALAGVTHHGFAHGTAGIGAFLLAAGQATGDRRYREMAHAAGAGLVRLATWDRDCAWWPTGEESDGSPTRMSHWCSGSSGIGTFLIRLWRADGHSEHRRLAMGAARAVRAERWRMGTAHCHGIAGDGHYLLDLAQILADGRYRVWAAELGAGLAARATVQDGRLLVPDETGNEFSAAFGTGCAGVLSFLIRLRDGGPRPWMVGDPR